jgi:hypothetical protein
VASIPIRGLYMNRLLMKLAITAMAGSLLSSNPMAGQVSPTTKRAASVRITEGPAPERADDYLTIIRWTTNNPGGSPEHYGIVRYGTNPKDLSLIAKSPIRLNPDHSHTIFRVRIEGLKPRTTYYYTVESAESTGKSDGVKSAVKQFTTDPQPRAASARGPGR